MKVRKQTRFAAVIGALFAASLTSVAIAGGTPSGAPSGATISGSSSIPSASMSFFSGSLTSSDGSTSPTPVSLSASAIAPPPSLAAILGGSPVSSVFTLVGPGGQTYTVSVLGSDSITVTRNN